MEREYFADRTEDRNRARRVSGRGNIYFSNRTSPDSESQTEEPEVDGFIVLVAERGRLGGRTGLVALHYDVDTEELVGPGKQFPTLSALNPIIVAGVSKIWNEEFDGGQYISGERRARGATSYRLDWEVEDVIKRGRNSLAQETD